MEYNSSYDELVIREYGRNIHKLILHAKKITEQGERQAYMEEIIDLMQRMYPQARNPEDSRLKLWHHAFMIAEFELDVVPPDGNIPTPEELYLRPERLAYPTGEPRYRYYGSNVMEMIKRAIKMDDGDIKSGYVLTIGAYMKMSYRAWNKEAGSSDDIIRRDLSNMSNGLLNIPEGLELEQEANQQQNYNRKQPVQQQQQQQKRYGGQQGNRPQFNKKKKFIKK
jgi:hypothetical protein